MITIEQRLQRLEDEAAIRDLAARFADAATRADYETIRSLFTPTRSLQSANLSQSPVRGSMKSLHTFTSCETAKTFSSNLFTVG